MDHQIKTRNQNRGWIAKLYAWACERLYHEFAWGYDVVSWVVSAGRWSNWRHAALGYMVTNHAENHSKPALELGFGTGELLIEGAKTGRKIIGLEPSPAMHSVTAKKLAKQTLQAQRIQASAQQIPFASESFDNILSTFPAPYILDPQTLRECQRVLAPNGRLIIVGLWTTVEHAWLATLLPLFYGKADQDLVAAIDQRLADAGLHAQFLDHADGFVRVSVVIAEKTK